MVLMCAEKPIQINMLSTPSLKSFPNVVAVLFGCVALCPRMSAETSAEAWLNIAVHPRKPEGSLGRTAQDGRLDSHTAPEL